MSEATEPNKNQQRITGQELSKMARKNISRDFFKKALRDEHFRELVRILLFMNVASVAANDGGEFKHEIVMTNARGEPVHLLIDVKIKPIEKRGTR